MCNYVYFTSLYEKDFNVKIVIVLRESIKTIFFQSDFILKITENI